ncbi:MAG: SpoIID/LytB domain-containing protein [Chloroflexi bacterium]|nr:SpoIID/LytB domain-containing protein [Chloroflexota bacterium]
MGHATMGHAITGGAKPLAFAARLMLLLAIGLVVATPAAASPPLDGSSAPGVYHFAEQTQALVFEGKGWGHGVGMCQWGARGRARAGQNAEQIIAAYYRGTAIQKSVSPETTIRVLVHSGLQLTRGESPRITTRGGPWLFETGGVPAIQAPAGGYLELSTGDGGPRYAVKAQDGATLGEGVVRSSLVLRPLEATTRFVAGYKTAAEVSGRPGVYYDTYRGELVLAPTGTNGSTLDTINRLSLEDYLRGVVPAEMPASWPAEALKAQTLAARSYAVWQAKSRAGKQYDVDDTTYYQVYLGANAERENVNRIIDATAGQIVVYGGQVAQTYFFSTCAGWTEDNEAVWPSGQPLPYLRSLHDVDPAGRPYDADSSVIAWSTGALTAGQLEEMLNADESTQIGRLIALDLSQRTASGRLTRVRATGTGGTKTFSPDTLMVQFNRMRPPGVTKLLSTNLDLKWTTAEAVKQTQGEVPTSTPTPQSVQSTPSVPPSTPAPASTLTPVFRLEMTQPAPERPSGPTNKYVPETGHNVGGAFLGFYDERGGLDIFGYPRTEELLEDGKTVQYFQRAKFEFHVDKVGTPYEVQLGLLGNLLTAARPPFATVAPFDGSDEHVYFPETGHGLHFAFLNSWRDRGGLDVFGYPITEELTENGITVQYFQRARFEYHPDLPEPYQVSLGLLGDQFLRERYWLQ